MVITIIGILIALLLPAVQAAREKLRDACSAPTTFKQVGIAMHNYHATQRLLSTRHDDSWYKSRSRRACLRQQGMADYYGWGWGAMILPYMEQQAVYDGIDFNGDLNNYSSPGNPKNLIMSATLLPGYMCPTDPQYGELLSYVGGSTSYPGHSANPLEDVAMSNMAGVCDSWAIMCGGYDMKQLSEADGTMATAQACAIEDVRDGTSNTLLIGECTGGGPGSHEGFYWHNFAIVTTRNGINASTTMPGGAPAYDWQNTGPSSYHPGGCNFLIADGSAQFLSQNIAQAVLAALTTRNGPLASNVANGAPSTEVLVSGPP